MVSEQYCIWGDIFQDLGLHFPWWSSLFCGPYGRWNQSPPPWKIRKKQQTHALQSIFTGTKEQPRISLALWCLNPEILRGRGQQERSITLYKSWIMITSYGASPCVKIPHAVLDQEVRYGDFFQEIKGERERETSHPQHFTNTNYSLLVQSSLHASLKSSKPSFVCCTTTIAQVSWMAP